MERKYMFDGVLYVRPIPDNYFEVKNGIFKKGDWVTHEESGDSEPAAGLIRDEIQRSGYRCFRKSRSITSGIISRVYNIGAEDDV